MPTNHSKETIDHKRVRGGYKIPDSKIKVSDVKKIIKKYYRLHIGKFFKISIVDEVSGTLNFRIESYHYKPVLLRIHKRIQDDDIINTIQRIQVHLYESDVFSDSPLKECLKPLKSTSGETIEHFNDRRVELYRFAEGVTHYSGQNIDQIKSFAYKYGSVQKRLQSFDASSSLNVLPHSQYINWFRSDEGLFDLICRINNLAIKYLPKDGLTAIFHQKQEFLRNIWDDVHPKMRDITPQENPILHDLHPHNTFFKGDNCLLIYDYEAVSCYWPEAEALAFTVHRFVREYIRLRHLGQGHEIEENIKRATCCFLEEYARGGMTIPPNFNVNLSLEIKMTNLAKLLSIMRQNHRIAADNANRSVDDWYRELIKFIAYLDEAKYFHL